VGGGNTARTQAFLTATGITDATIISALNTMDNSLISAGLLPAGTGAGKIKALYPIVGGSATAHKYNFIDPRNLDAAFRLSFSGGWTHSATGMLPNGVNAYADTFYNPSTDLADASSAHMSYYSRTDNNYLNVLMGCYPSGIRSYLLAKIGAGLFHALNGAESSGGVGSDWGDASGFFITNRISASEMSLFRNTTKKLDNSSGAAAATGKPIYKIIIGGYNLSAGTPTLGLPTDRECAFSSIGEGLTDVEQTNYYNAVQAFQTALGRNV